MPHHARIPTLLAALVMVLGLAGFTTAHDSAPAPDAESTAGPTAGSASAPATATVAAPRASLARPVPGESVTLSGSIGSGVTRVVLQSFDHGAWRSVQEQTVAGSGDYAFAVTQPAWSARWRVLAPATEGEADERATRVSRPRTLFGQVQHATTSTPRSVHAGDKVAVSSFVSPARRGRPITLQRDTGDGWHHAADLTTDETGRATRTFEARHPGKTRFRTVARAHHGAPAVVGAATAVYALGERPVGVMAWRGDSADHPENTLDAFRSAVRHRADFIEMDFQPTADGEWVLMHDDDLRRTTDVESRFPERESQGPRAFTLEEIKQLDAGSWKAPRFRGTQVPSIEETFDAIGAAEKAYGHDVRLVVELKGESSAEMRALYRKVVALRPGWVEPKGHSDKAIFMSFDESHFDFPGAEATGMERIAVKDEPDPADDYPAGYDQVHIGTGLLSASLVSHYRRQGAEVGTWPAVGTPAVLRAAAAGVDYVTTDDVAAARKALLR
ncbi:glycerophosphoryl diester phosphodiesterase [Nocardioides albertanoniae]|uniref:Glycerophosphoryl diester phosphodiesterase n=1 Tax=Nocardioides albertanoniae TaxID=1175486 RepID=A0A543A770_9ACTN|nr:glycerophosphodiester phosphodiesterase family protein [Nocardioides albertanoniae]TQL68428.1 glycerophosphoryl diester phosphodiesterase [Nocardioides albertanoniae]